MLYKYGGSIFGTMSDTNRHVEMYRSENLEFVVNQSIWHEGEANLQMLFSPPAPILNAQISQNGQRSVAMLITAKHS